MKLKYSKTIITLLISIFLFPSCEHFVEVPAPDNKLIRDVVFNNDDTARSAMTGIYNQLFLSAFSNGDRSSITLLSGLSGDIIKNIYDNNIIRMQFQQHELSPDNISNLDIWSSAYNIIYMTNSMLEGLENSQEVTTNVKIQLEGEAKFVRAFTYFYLINLYNDVPLLLTTNYQKNQLAARTPSNEVYEQIIKDLNSATELLSPEYLEGERTQVNSYTAIALEARVHLYLKEWDKSEVLSSKVIQESSTYNILENLDEVFLANSKEAIWQISPIGEGGFLTHTNEGDRFIIDPIYTFLAGIELEENFVNVFVENDNRLSNWIGYNPELNAYFAYKYKIRSSSDFPIKEYSMVMRLAEQYLIRAEARAELGKISDAIDDLDVIRERAGIELIAEINPTISKEELLDKIFEERKKELFTEWGHRWFDLKRSGRVNEIIGSQSSLWQPSDIWYPIPTEERMKNPNLSQNNNY